MPIRSRSRTCPPTSPSLGDSAGGAPANLAPLPIRPHQGSGRPSRKNRRSGRSTAQPTSNAPLSAELLAVVDQTMEPTRVMPAQSGQIPPPWAGWGERGSRREGRMRPVPGEATELDPPEPAPPLGLGLRPEPLRLMLAQGDRILLYTDGVSEARAPAGSSPCRPRRRLRWSAPTWRPGWSRCGLSCNATSLGSSTTTCDSTQPRSVWDGSEG